MGLGIVVGMRADLLGEDPEGVEWFDEEATATNRVLAAHGLAAHVEPDVVDPWAGQSSMDGAPYSFIHVLRGAYAGVVRTGGLPAGGTEAGDREVAALGDDLSHHLVQHSDAEGWYVPIDFPQVLLDDQVPGRALGSVQRLQAELLLVAPALGIGVEAPGGPVDAPSLAAIEEASDNEDDAADPFWKAKEIWLTLYDATRHSLASGAALVFC